MTKTKALSKFALAISIPFLCFLGAYIGYRLLFGYHAKFVSYASLPICLAVIITIALLGIRVLRSEISRRLLKQKIPILLLSTGIVIIYNLVDHRSEKIVFDELIIQAAAIQLLHTNEYMVPEYSHNLKSQFTVVSSMPDKRPPLFPVLLSLVHRAVGYSQHNGYLLNSILGIGFFFILGNIGKAINPRNGDLLIILVFASLPLVSQNVTSQHFEILYLFLIACLFWIAFRIFCEGKIQEIPLAYLVAAAISLTRYEGLMFLSVPFFLHLHTVWKAGRVKGITPVLILCPLVSLFIFALLGHITERGSYWQLDYLESDQAFGLQFWGHNLAAFADFLFNANREQPGSMALSLLGMAAVPVAVLEFVRWGRTAFKKGDIASSPVVPLILFAICAVLYLSLFFSYHWGWVNSPETARFMLFPALLMAAFMVLALQKNPFLTLLSGTLVALFSGVKSILGLLEGHTLQTVSYLFVLVSFMVGMLLVKRNSKHFPICLLGFWIIYLLVETLPAIQQARYERNCIPAKTVALFHDWVDERKDSNSVFISKTQTLGVIHEESSTSLLRFHENPNSLRDLKGRHFFTDVYVLQAVEMDGSVYGSPAPEYAMPEGIEWELVEFSRISDEFGARMVRIVSWGNQDES